MPLGSMVGDLRDSGSLRPAENDSGIDSEGGQETYQALDDSGTLADIFGAISLSSLKTKHASQSERKVFQLCELIPSVDKEIPIWLIQNRLVDPSEQDSKSRFALHLATRKGSLGVIAALLHGGADTSITTTSGCLPLHYFCMHATRQWSYNQFNTVFHGLLRGNSVNHRNKSGETPLHYCVKGRADKEMMRILLKHGADPEQTNETGQTASDMAMRNKRNKDAIDILLDLIGSVSAGLHSEAEEEEWGATPFGMAGNKFSLPVAGDDQPSDDHHDSEMETGSGINRVHDCCHAAAKAVIMPSPLYARKESQGEPPPTMNDLICLAVRQQKDKVLEFLCGQGGFDPTEVYVDGNTILHIACKQGTFDSIDMLLEYEFDPAIANDSNTFPFHMFCERDFSRVHDDEFEYIFHVLHGVLPSSTGVNTANYRGACPLHFACMGNGDVRLVKWLLLHGASLTTKAVGGLTPLEIVKMKETTRADVVRILENPPNEVHDPAELSCCIDYKKLLERMEESEGKDTGSEKSSRTTTPRVEAFADRSPATLHQHRPLFGDTARVESTMFVRPKDLANIEGNVYRDTAKTGEKEEPVVVLYDGADKELRGVVKAANFTGLLQFLSTKPDPQFRQAFVLSFRNFCKPIDLLVHLLDEYMRDGTDEEVMRRRLRIVGVLKDWMKVFPGDFTEEETCKRLRGFMDVEKSSMSTGLTLQLQGALEKALSADNPQLDFVADMQPGSRRSARKRRSTRFSREVLSVIENLTFAKVDLDILAQEITFRESTVFLAITWGELVKWLDGNKDECPIISEVVRHFNEMGLWVATEICTNPILKERVTIIQRCVELSEKLLELQNFNGVMEILSGLNHGAVSRLKQTWGALSKNWSVRVERIRGIMSSSSNFHNYRKSLRESLPPCIPYMGILMTDLTFLKHGSPDTLEDGLINFSKCYKVASLVKTMLQFQVAYDNLVSNEAMCIWLSSINAIDDDALYRVSKAIEAPVQTIMQPKGIDNLFDSGGYPSPLAYGRKKSVTDTSAKKKRRGTLSSVNTMMGSDDEDSGVGSDVERKASKKWSRKRQKSKLGLDTLGVKDKEKEKEKEKEKDNKELPGMPGSGGRPAGRSGTLDGDRNLSRSVVLGVDKGAIGFLDLIPEEKDDSARSSGRRTDSEEDETERMRTARKKKMRVKSRKSLANLAGSKT